jgi:hypothetical protein
MFNGLTLALGNALSMPKRLNPLSDRWTERQ